MNVRFEIKLGEAVNKNFLVFISTELAKKLNYELQGTDELNWSFKKGNSSLDISDGYISKELFKEKYDYSRKYELKEKETLIKGVLVVNFTNVDSIDSVNSVFDIVNKYANLIINEDNENDELTQMLDETAVDEDDEE